MAYSILFLMTIYSFMNTQFTRLHNNNDKKNSRNSTITKKSVNPDPQTSKQTDNANTQETKAHCNVSFHDPRVNTRTRRERS